MYPSWTQCRDLEVQQRRTIEKDQAEQEIAALHARWSAAIFRKLLVQRRKQRYASEKVCVQAVPPAFIDVNRGARVSMEIVFPGRRI